VNAGFDMTYSQDAELGHAFAAVYEWVIEGRAIPVVPIFVNTYLPPLPTAKRCAQLGAAIKDAVAASPYKVAIVASGGMSHYPGAWKYPQPAYDFDWWAIAQMERGHNDALLKLTSEQLDEVGNTELLPWMVMFGAIGNLPGELITYQPTWHHGHAVMRFIPNKKNAPTTPEPEPAFQFQSGGFQFYKHPDPAVYPLNKLLFDLRFSQPLRRRLFETASAGGCGRASAGYVDVAHRRASRAAAHATGTGRRQAINGLRFYGHCYRPARHSRCGTRQVGTLSAGHRDRRRDLLHADPAGLV
jgi:hypothetical protein